MKDAATRYKRRFVERVVGQAIREGADAEKITIYLSREGIQQPDVMVKAVGQRAALPYLSIAELMGLGGRSAFRIALGLVPDDRSAPQEGSHAGLSVEDFLAYMPAHRYICIPTWDICPATSVNARIPSPTQNAEGKPIPPSVWLDRHRHVEQMTWCPGRPTIVDNMILSEGGWVPRHGLRICNLYREPLRQSGDPTQAQRWI